MSYSRRKRYTSRREKNKKAARTLRLTALIIVGLIVFAVIKDWTSIRDYLLTYTY